MVVFHVFKIVQMVPNRLTHHIMFYIDLDQHYRSPKTIAAFSGPNTEIAWGAYIARLISSWRNISFIWFDYRLYLWIMDYEFSYGLTLTIL